MRPIITVLLVCFLAVVSWGVFLVWDANQNLGRTSALSGAANTPGTTYLLAGSDSRADGAIQNSIKKHL